MSNWAKFVNNVPLRRFTVLGVVVLILYFARSMMSTLLLTFIFCLLVVKLTNGIRRFVKIPSEVIVVIVYLLVLAGLYFGVTVYIPQVADQAISSTKDIVDFYSNPSNLPDDNTLRWVNELIKQSNVMAQMKNGVSLIWRYITGVGTMGITLFLSMILSFFFAIEKKTMYNFSHLFLDSDFSWFFQDLYFFGKKFVATFGVVIEAQFFYRNCEYGFNHNCLGFYASATACSISADGLYPELDTSSRCDYFVYTIVISRLFRWRFTGCFVLNHYDCCRSCTGSLCFKS